MKLKIAIATISLTIVLMALLFSSPNGCFIHLAYASDVHGNDINFIEIWQYNGTDYVLRANLTSSGGTYLLYDSQPTKFVANIKFNNTLAIDEATAIDCTKIIMNITDIWTNEEFNNTACTLVGDFYVLTETGIWNEEGKPESGVTYECSVIYQGYY